MERLRAIRLATAAKVVENGIDDTPATRPCCNSLERLMREIRRRTRVVGGFPDAQSALMRVAARLRHVAAAKWGTNRYLQMERLAKVMAIP